MVPGAVAGRNARVLGWRCYFLVTYVRADMWGMQEYAGEICLGEDIYEDNSWRGEHICGHVCGVLGTLHASILVLHVRGILRL